MAGAQKFPGSAATTTWSVSSLALLVALIGMAWMPAVAQAQSFPPINNHSPEWVSHTNNDSVYFHGSLSQRWSAAAVSYFNASTPTDYDLGLHETTGGFLVTSSELSGISELIVIDGNNNNAGSDYFLQAYHYSGPGGEYVEVSDAATTQALTVGVNDLTMPAGSIVRCYEAFLEAGRDYEFVMQSAQQQNVAAYGFLYAPTVGWYDYHDNLMGDDGFQVFAEDLDEQGVVRTITAPTTGYYGFVVLMLHEENVSQTFWIDVFDVTTPPGGGGSTSIEVSPSSHSFSATEGGLNPAALTSNLEITNGPATWSASASVPWLAVSPSSGTDDGTVPLQISVDISGMSAGSYSGTVSVDAGSAANSPQTINVTLQISASGSGGSGEGGGTGGSGTIRAGSGTCAAGIQQGAAPLGVLLVLMLCTLLALRRQRLARGLRAKPADFVAG